MQQNPRSGNTPDSLRVLIKSLGLLVKQEDILNQQVYVLVEKPDVLKGVLTAPSLLDAAVKRNYERMQGDYVYPSEHAQLGRQSKRPRDMIYSKFYQVDYRENHEIAVMNGNKLIMKFSLFDVKDLKEIYLKEIGIFARYQKSLNMVVIEKEGAAQYGKEDGEGNGDSDNEQDQRILQRKNNPFNQKITAKDHMKYGE